jgi:hypothetical protein
MAAPALGNSSKPGTAVEKESRRKKKKKKPF